MIEQPARWRQRHENFAKAVVLLDDAVRQRRHRHLSDLEQAGLVQRYEIVWELGWKLLADCLKALGHELDVVAPRPVIRAAFAAGLIANGQAWIDATDTRNMLSHLYDEKKAARAIEAIATQYLAVMQALNEKLADDVWLGNSA